MCFTKYGTRLDLPLVNKNKTQNWWRMAKKIRMKRFFGFFSSFFAEF